MTAPASLALCISVLLACYVCTVGVVCNSSDYAVIMLPAQTVLKLHVLNVRQVFNLHYTVTTKTGVNGVVDGNIKTN